MTYFDYICEVGVTTLHNHDLPTKSTSHDLIAKSHDPIARSHDHYTDLANSRYDPEVLEMVRSHHSLDIWYTRHL